MSTSLLEERTKQVLEWNALLEALASHAASRLGGERCRELAFAQDLEQARRQQQETFELVQVFEESSTVPVLHFPDVRPLFSRVEKGGILDGPELRDISIVLSLSQRVTRWLDTHRDRCPNVGQRAEAFQDVSWVGQTLEQCLDEYGNLRESATPVLSELTQKSQSLRHTMRRRLESLVASPQYETCLQGQYFAERENRYVIPVKAERQHDIDGIIHDISSSGATVFIEPRHLIELNNAIKFAELQASQEARRILHDLCTVVAESVDLIQNNLDRLADLDCLMAKARLSRKIQGRPVQLNQSSRIHLIHAKHPLLLLAKDDVVANTIRIDKHIDTFIISGPNTGGKTVTLKLIGLVGLMVKVGLLPPCAADSEMEFYQTVFADIGDTQDLSRNLSSFSSHILFLVDLFRELVSCAQPTPPSCLVLLDEVGNSTDPIEGAALAEAILSRLSELGCLSIVTTHYPSLKTLAIRKPHVQNATQEFDLDNLAPTYRLIDGIPGGSSALNIAGRLGLEAAILDQARALIQQDDRGFDEIFQKLQDTASTLEKERAQAQQLRLDAQRLHDETCHLREQLSTQERNERERYRKRWQREFSQAQREVNQLLHRIKQTKTAGQVEAVKHTLSHINQHMKAQFSFEQSLTDQTPTVGDHVEIDDLGTLGILQEDVDGKKLVSILVGTQTMKVAPSRLRLARSSGENTEVSKSPYQEFPSRTSQTFTPSGSSNVYQCEHDFRGKRLEEALEATLTALDDALLAQAHYVKIIHGKGSGALRSGIRKLCQSSPYTKNIRAGDPTEGGDGVTVIELQ